MNVFGSTRSRVCRDHALIAPDSFVRSTLPGWEKAEIVILISPQLGARFTQYLAFLQAGAVCGPALPGVGVANVGFARGAAQRGWRLGSGDGSRGEKFVEIAEGADTAALFADIGQPSAGRISFASPVSVRVRPICTKARPGSAAGDR